MRITSFDIVTIAIPMRVSVEHALARRHTARNVLVAVRDESALTGWGECCPRPYVTGETVESAESDLQNVILPALLGQSFDSLDGTAESLLETLDGLRRNQQAAFCAAELAVLDLAGKAFGRSAGDWLGPVVAPTVHYSGVIAAKEPQGVAQQAGLARKFGVRDVKVKVGPSLEANLEVLATARTALGEDVNLRIDANCAWSGGEAIRQLEAMAEFRLVGVEQPVPADDLEGMKAVTASGLVPVVADESLCTLADARMLIEEAACNVFNVRISKCGGMINAGRIHQLAADAELPCQLGAQVGETGILSAAGRHFVTRREGVIWAEGSYGKLLLEEDITEPDVTVGPRGAAPALEAPGLGVVPVAERLEKYITRKRTVGETAESPGRRRKD